LGKSAPVGLYTPKFDDEFLQILLLKRFKNMLSCRFANQSIQDLMVPLLNSPSSSKRCAVSTPGVKLKEALLRGGWGLNGLRSGFRWFSDVFWESFGRNILYLAETTMVSGGSSFKSSQ